MSNACNHANVTNGTACPDDGNACTNDTCQSGACSHPNKSDGTSCGTGDRCCSGQCRDCCTTSHCDDSDPCTGTETCVGNVCQLSITDCNSNDVEDICDITDETSEDCDGNLTPDECQQGSIATALIGSVPGHNETLWRTQKNTIRLTFACDISAPTSGQVLIQELQSGGAYGSDLSGSFSFTVENTPAGHPRVLRIRETTPALTHRTWYGIRNTGSWSSAGAFNVHHLVQVGDADNNGTVINSDPLLINANAPQPGAPDDSRLDIDGNGSIVNADVLLSNAHVVSNFVTKPSGH